ncbi:hypothetical protein C2S52_018775 [Perilla frutescens var. hirtella]|nr:hypothetical protein C2S52_018775 [Perilla frutescens var. hirtella]
MNCGRWKLIVFVLVVTKLSESARGQDQNPFVCLRNGNYTSESRYAANLNSLLSSLPTNTTDTGFFNASVGQGQDTVNAIALCRGDRTPDQCRACVQAASEGLPQQCPVQKQAIIWYEFCMLRYSNEPIYATQTSDPGRILRNTATASSPDEFRAARTRMFDVVRVQAAGGGPALKVGAGSANISDSRMVYGLMQCTPDISEDECDNCLQRAVQNSQSCCDTAPGVRVLMPSCILRYDHLQFLYTCVSIYVCFIVLIQELIGTNDNNTSPGKKDDNTTKVILIIVIPVGVVLLVAVCAIFFMRRRMKPTIEEIPHAIDDISTVESLQYDFGKIRAATNDFADANKLGEGGFGAVYRGNLPTGEEIAVKRLSKDSGQGIVEFKNEVLLVAKLQHRNLVRLLGFSTEGIERLLIYEFVQNASLDKFIFDPIKRSQLDWDKRYKIIGGIAKGLVYLHEDSRLKIIHRDLKASNILLDGDMNPKIADFGMARLFRQDETQGNTSKIVGTYGYMSPEYAMHGQFSIKSDVYSFGVLILEIITGQRNIYIQSGENAQDLMTLAWKNWQEGTGEKVIDPTLLKNGTSYLRDMLRCIHMGLLCVQENAANRPTMASVVLMLSSSTVTLPLPSEPAFYMASRFGPAVSVVQEYDSKDSSSGRASNHIPNAGISQDSSTNEMSVTELYPR